MASGFADGAWRQPTFEGAYLWLVRSDTGWIAIKQEVVQLLEDKVAAGPPYDGDVRPPSHTCIRGAGRTTSTTWPR